MQPATGLPAYLRALGLAVRRRREAIGMSQEAFALKADVDRTYVSGIERGIRNPTVSTIMRLTRVLGVTPATLLRSAERLAE